jgi:hypothetical protein
MEKSPAVAAGKLTLDEIVKVIRERPNCVGLDVDKDPSGVAHEVATITAWFQSDPAGVLPLRARIVSFGSGVLIAVEGRDSAELHQIVIHSLPKPAIIKA